MLRYLHDTARSAEVPRGRPHSSFSSNPGRLFIELRTSPTLGREEGGLQRDKKTKDGTAFAGKFDATLTFQVAALL